MKMARRTIAERIRSDERVREYYQDSDGYWAELRPGYVREGDAHVVHEYSHRDVWRVLRTEVVICDCSDCRASLYQETEK
jgi:hypothetical protein